MSKGRDDPFWHTIGAGALNSYLLTILATPGDQAGRKNHDAESNWRGWISVMAAGATGYTITTRVVNLLINEIPDVIEHPRVRNQSMAGRPPYIDPAEVSVSGGNTLVYSVDPGPDCETYVFQWNSTTRVFTEVGDLATNSQPGAGTYVLTNVFVDDGEVTYYGLCSIFMNLTS